MIIENYFKVVNPNPAPVILQVKNIQYNNPVPKFNTIQRHYSEDDFRKLTALQPGYFVESPMVIKPDN